jgi:hypothetical protein
LPGTPASPQGVTPGAGENATYLGASPDGTGIAFEIGSKLYLRLDNSVTYEIGQGVEFAGVSEEGRRVFYVEAGNLLAFDTGTGQVIPFSQTGDATVVNVATGGARAYFISETVIADSGVSPTGEEAHLGAQNLYLSVEGQIHFVAAVTERDVIGEQPPGRTIFVDGLGTWTEVLADRQPARDPSRLNPDGTVLVFQSRANLVGYDSGEAPEIYRYDSIGERLDCISCLPTNGAASGGASLQSYTFDTASSIPFTPSGFVPGITPDGRRVFFESPDALVSRDTDAVRDVYEWEEAGTGSCNRAGGCVYLISSGRSTRDNYLYGHSTSGDDVFFTTTDVLVDSDTGGTLSIYDARVNGGVAEPQGEGCSGEGCKSELSPSPSLTPPAHPSLGAKDNVSKRRHCPRGKRRVKRHGKVRCVKKHRRHHHRKAGAKKKGTAR